MNLTELSNLIAKIDDTIQALLDCQGTSSLAFEIVYSKNCYMWGNYKGKIMIALRNFRKEVEDAKTSLTNIDDKIKSYSPQFDYILTK